MLEAAAAAAWLVTIASAAAVAVALPQVPPALLMLPQLSYHGWGCLGTASSCQQHKFHQLHAMSTAPDSPCVNGFSPQVYGRLRSGAQAGLAWMQDSSVAAQLSDAGYDTQPILQLLPAAVDALQVMETADLAASGDSSLFPAAAVLGSGPH